MHNPYTDDTGAGSDLVHFVLEVCLFINLGKAIP